jgi:heptosyltransferase-2
MNVLILKLNATGDVVRTTPLLRRLTASVTWVTAAVNITMLDDIWSGLRCISWEDRARATDRGYDLLVNLEDEAETAAFAREIRHDRLFGAYLSEAGDVQYTDDAARWFDMSLISRFGRKRADELKFQNRSTYQDIIFEGLGMRFLGEAYVLPQPVETGLSGDVAVAPVAGPVWPMKNWAYYSELAAALVAQGLRVNVLPRRATLREHLGDIAGHRCLVGGDSLPMHLALGTGRRCVTIFNCTSPWEIHDYGLQSKIVSPLIGEFFYKRGLDQRATHAVTLDDVLAAVTSLLSTQPGPSGVSPLPVA